MASRSFRTWTLAVSATGVGLILLFLLLSAYYRAPPQIFPHAETVVVDFEDDPQNAAFIVCDPTVAENELDGVLTPYPIECDPAHHEWIRSKGVDVKGIRNGFIRTTMVGGNWLTGVVLEYSDRQGGNPGFQFAILNSTAKSFVAEVITSPLIDLSNVTASAMLKAFDSDGRLIKSTSYNFTTVTNGQYTPARLAIETPDFNIGTVTLEVTNNPTHEFWIESLSFTRLVPTPAIDKTPPAITVPLPWDWRRTDAFENDSAPIYYGDDPSWFRVYDAQDGEIKLSNFKAHEPSYEFPEDQDVASDLGSFVCDPPSGSLFPIGKTLVTCVATDSAGNVSTRTFFVGVGLCKVISEGTIECRPQWP